MVCVPFRSRVGSKSGSRMNMRAKLGNHSMRRLGAPACGCTGGARCTRVIRVVDQKLHTHTDCRGGGFGFAL